MPKGKRPLEALYKQGKGGNEKANVVMELIDTRVKHSEKEDFSQEVGHHVMGSWGWWGDVIDGDEDEEDDDDDDDGMLLMVIRMMMMLMSCY